MNNVTLVGNLVRDPELSYTPNTQTAVCRFTIAIDRPKKDGQDQGADYPRIIVWGRQAENCDRYLSKGSKVGVIGRIQTGSYKDKNGQTVYTTDVIANNVEFLTATGGDNSTSDRRNDARPSNTPSRNDAPPQTEYEPMDSFQQVEGDEPW